jgi:hypothetical protein
MASTQLITDTNSLIANGPSTTTKANSIAAAGPIQDYIGNTQQLLTKLQEVKTLATLLISDTAASDDNTNLTLLTGITGSFV